MLDENTDDAYMDDERKAVRFLETNHHIARREVEQALGFSQAKTIRLLNTLAGKGAIKKEGQGRNTRYSIMSSPKP
jgi:predicted HTH transcriptional regulator